MIKNLMGDKYEGPYTTTDFSKLVGYNVRQLRKWVREKEVPKGIRIIRAGKGNFQWFLDRELFLSSYEIKKDCDQINFTEEDIYAGFE